ncbi:MAG: hypothetical protein KC731_41095 [Myxococcales bacterium]|nr:hypothetical protein [Myxococcales bacterium]
MGLAARHAYRDDRAAAAARRDELSERLAELDEDLDRAPSSRRLGVKARARIAHLRQEATPVGDSHAALARAEQAAERLEALLDESLGLDAELRKNVEPWLPSRMVVARWLGLSALALATLAVVVQQLGGDFMLRAVGVEASRASHDVALSEPIRRALTAHLVAKPTPGPPPLPGLHELPEVVPPHPPSDPAEPDDAP